MNRVPALSAPVEAASATFEAGLRQRLFEVESRNLAALAGGQSQIRIGRDPDNDLVFESRLVSKHHAVLERTPDGFRLRDLRSTHGTYVNGDRIQSALLPSGSEVQIADETFRFDSSALHRSIEPRGMRVDVSNIGRVVAGGKQLLHDISLSILPGDLVAIVGGSGAGKTTLMDAIAGIHPATSGQVLYNGRDYYRNLPASGSRWVTCPRTTSFIKIWPSDGRSGSPASSACRRTLLTGNCRRSSIKS